ncbi:GHKL domain-containing protein [Mucilaginibacter daejeonensis]|uniref:sensor histidine kinase n=1 Tax=Mucilaginibacter daejeonensis TaxID=398049 RepID=UPI001D176A87|nr:7TM diverse intracellular signaling domain-containing protein [Mucilaginibacter daejeonensis]UEG55072.1 GHKL domain-containing protein [Mucilaginibacter daejeonensis]
MKRWLSICILLLISIVAAQAQITYSGHKRIATVGDGIAYYIDSSGKHTVQTIQNQANFTKVKAAVPNLGLTDKPVWLKVDVKNQSDLNDLILQFDQPLLESITFYYPANGSFAGNVSGERYPFGSRPVNYHKFLYHLNIPPGGSSVYYVRITSSHPMQMPVFLGDKESIEDLSMSKNILFGVFFGIILVMFFYNLFVYISVKDPIYIYYVIYILVVGLTQTTIEGYSFQYLWPNNTFLATRSFFLLTALVNITGLEFVRQFLHTKDYLPRLDKFAFLIYGVYLLVIVLTVLGQLRLSYMILQGFGGVVSLYMLAVAVIIARRGNRSAKFFLIAWLPLIAGIIIWILKDMNVLPYNLFTNYSITYGSALEVILLSFALADKINIFKAEKERSQEETLQALKENERIIREQNVILEAKVNERTLELSKANSELNVTLEDLKQAQTQLVESEKMASLGQLTAGIAHEINNPINFVTSNIKPLRRDIEMVMDTLRTVEGIAMMDITAAEKQKQIEEHKEDMDFEYLQDEIAHLMKGITEGANRTAEIVKGLRIFSRLDEDDLKRADINEGIESTLVIANNLMGKISVVKQLGQLPPIECYAGKLNQVFLNIISNAAYAVHKKFGDQPGGQISIKTYNDDHDVFIELSDNGIGMSEKTQKKIFEPFFTTKEVGEGTGLGMSIAYNTIKKHNGNITLESTEGEGTSFIIKLPIIFVM